MAYGKKSLKEKANAAFRKLVGITALVGAACVPGWYYYGTVQETEVKIVSVNLVEIGEEKIVKDWGSYSRTIYATRFVTDKGVLKNENTYAHLKFDAKDIEGQIADGKTYRITYYGKRFSFPIGSMELYPNIISAKPVSEQELAERAKMKAKEKQQQQAQQSGPAAQQQSAVTPPAAVVQQGAGVLSGEVTTLDLFANGYRVQVTMPVEAAGKIVVNTVKPLTPAPKAPGT
jgi:hypothetical protein